MTTISVPSDTTTYGCRFERRAEVGIVHLQGEIDVFAARQLWPLIDDVVAGQGLLHVELDLASTTFLDAAGMQMLLTTQRLVEASGGDLRVTGASPFTRRLFTIAGLGDELLGEPTPSTIGRDPVLRLLPDGGEVRGTG
jgi:anti-sigma B factor antagonist